MHSFIFRKGTLAYSDPPSSNESSVNAEPSRLSHLIHAAEQPSKRSLGMQVLQKLRKESECNDAIFCNDFTFPLWNI